MQWHAHSGVQLLPKRLLKPYNDALQRLPSILREANFTSCSLSCQTEPQCGACSAHAAVTESERAVTAGRCGGEDPRWPPRAAKPGSGRAHCCPEPLPRGPCSAPASMLLVSRARAGDLGVLPRLSMGPLRARLPARVLLVSLQHHQLPSPHALSAPACLGHSLSMLPEAPIVAMIPLVRPRADS